MKNISLFLFVARAIIGFHVILPTGKAVDEAPRKLDKVSRDAAIDEISEHWVYAGVFQLSADGSKKMVEHLKGVFPGGRNAMGASDYSNYSKLTGGGGKIYYLWLVFENGSQGDKNSNLVSETLTERIIILGWQEYRKASVKYSSLVKEGSSRPEQMKFSIEELQDYLKEKNGSRVGP